MNSKNMLLKILSLLMVFGMLITACGTPATATDAPAPAGTDEPAATEEPAFAAGTTLTYIASQNWVLDSELELAEAFEAETGVHVDFQIIPADQYFNDDRFDFDHDRSKPLVVLAAFVDTAHETVTLRGVNFGKKALTVF